MFFNPAAFGLKYEMTDPFFDPITREATHKGIHYTMVFHAFILMSFCQEINSRKIYEYDFNVFEGITKNKVYIFIMILSVAIQMVFVQMGG